MSDNVAKHRVDLLDGDEIPVHSAPHQARPTARKFAAAETGRVITGKVIEPETPGRAGPTVFDPKKDGSLRFCIDDRIPNAVTVRDSYL